jgi:hypothetical protein
MLLPLTPLLVEWLSRGGVQQKSIGLLSGMWVISLAVSSDSHFLLLMGMLVGLILVATLGVMEGQPGTAPSFPNLPLNTMFVAGIAFGLERAYKHLWKGVPCSPPEKE